MKLTEMKQVLAQGDIRLTKSLGQNFLHDANVLRRIVAAGNLQPEDKILEIGPGLGPLTEVLLAGAGEVLAIETDERLVVVLQKRFGASAGKLQLIHADALDYLRSTERDWGDWKLVANLPYSVASTVLVELAHSRRGPRHMVATLQIEVARRLMAKSGESDYGLLSLLIQLDYEPAGWFKIPATCFFPEPEVGSACVALKRREEPLLAQEQRKSFIRIVKRGFSQRRKMMFKLLKADWPTERLGEAFARLNLSPTIRAEAVSLEDFVRLTRLLCTDFDRERDLR